MTKLVVFSFFLVLFLFVGLSFQQTVISISDCATFCGSLKNVQADTIYELSNDIYCQGILTQPLPPFGGVLDGKNFAIIGLNINLASGPNTALGLFSKITSGAVIKNLYFLDSTVQANDQVLCSAGTLAGVADCSQSCCVVSNVHVGTSLKSTFNTVQNYGQSVGGLIGVGLFKEENYFIYFDTFDT